MRQLTVSEAVVIVLAQMQGSLHTETELERSQHRTLLREAYGVIAFAGNQIMQDILAAKRDENDAPKTDDVCRFGV